MTRMGAWKRAAGLAASVLAVGLAAACGANAGGSCSDEDAAVCDGDDKMLVCEDGKYREVPCRGPGGCKSNSDTVSCDYSAAQSGDACPGRGEGQSTCTTVDTNSRLKCTNGRWVSETCITGCRTVNDSTVCI
jgi:hypothetical protein